MSDLDKLIEAIEAATLPEPIFHGSSSVRGHWSYTTGLDAGQRRSVFMAYNGSLDAAKALHDALLPGWGWAISADGASVYGDDPKVYDVDNAHIPARAWLLAILKAYRETQP